MIRRACMSLAAAAVLTAAPAWAATIASEDFEGGASGWSDNTTTIGNAVLGNEEFLGRFGGSGGAQDVTKTFLLSGLQTQVTISFDFLRLDTWDDEIFSIFIDDNLVASDAFGLTATPAPANAVLVTPFGQHGFNGDFFGSDEVFRYTFTVPTTAASVKLGFGSNLNDFIEDESYGIDNLLITDDLQAVPEPSSLVLFGSALLAWGLRRRRTGS